jgi:hypothetical protein
VADFNQSEVAVVKGAMELSDGTSSVAFSPLIQPGIRRPDNRTRGVHQYDGGPRQYWDASGGERHDFSLNNISKADADQLNQWWQNLTILHFLSDGIAIYANLDGDSQFFYRDDVDFPESGITGDMTIQAWIKLDTITASMAIASKYDAGAAKRCYYFGVINDELRLFVSDNGAASTTANSTNASLVQDVWVHVAVTYDASAGSAIFYKDGVVLTDDGASLENSIANLDPDFKIGALNAAPTFFFDGSIAHVAIFDDIRTPAEILASADAPKIDLSAEGNIIAQWHFDEDDAATAIDNTQGDAGRDLTPYDGGDVNFGNCGRERGTIHARLSPAGSRPFQWMEGQTADTLHEAVVTIVEVSSSSSV